MKIVAKLLVAFVTLSHIGFLTLEMFFWNHPVGHRIFAMTPEVAAGRTDVTLFFLGCVIVE